MNRSNGGHAALAILGILLLGSVALAPAYGVSQHGASDRIGVSARVVHPAEIERIMVATEARVRVSNADQVRISANGAVAESAGDGFRLSRTGTSERVTVTIEY